MNQEDLDADLAEIAGEATAEAGSPGAGGDPAGELWPAEPPRDPQALQQALARLVEQLEDRPSRARLLSLRDVEAFAMAFSSGVEGAADPRQRALFDVLTRLSDTAGQLGGLLLPGAADSPAMCDTVSTALDSVRRNLVWLLQQDLVSAG